MAAPASDSVDTVTAFLLARGVHARPVRRVVGLLCAGWQPLDHLVRETGVPRRTVEQLLAAFGDDVERDGAALRVRPERTDAHRALLPIPPLTRDDLVPDFEDLLRRVPTPRRALDHVQATAATMADRAHWLEATYHLPGAQLVCAGDHDLTALAACTLQPGLTATVVDLDDDLLAFVDREARARGLRVRCLHADFRHGLPPSVAGSADLVFTDPPYTPEGVRLFVARGVECLRDPAEGRVLLAYGYSDRTPALGLKVQQEVQRLAVAFEAILPGFNRYLGAQAVGSSSDLYVCQPTARSRKLAEAATSAAGQAGIYTHGPQSVESGGTDPAAVAALLRLARGDGPAQPALTGPGWDQPVTGGPVAVDLAADPGPWLLRTLLAGPAARVAALVGNNHPDLADQRGQEALRELVSAKYRLTFHRSTPDGKHAVVVGEPVAGEGVAAALLARAHGKLGNVWREALIRASGGTLTKREARERIAELADPADLDQRLVDLPRHRLATALHAADAPRP